MPSITLQFPSIVELIEFEALLVGVEHITSRSQLTIIGDFTAPDVQIAIGSFKAFILDNQAPKNQF